MTFVYDSVVIVNLILCVAILIVGLIGWRRSGNDVPLYIALAFGLFGFSHLMTLLGLADSLKTALIVVRSGAYLVMLFTVYELAYLTRIRNA